MNSAARYSYGSLRRKEAGHHNKKRQMLKERFSCALYWYLIESLLLIGIQHHTQIYPIQSERLLNK